MYVFVYFTQSYTVVQLSHICSCSLTKQRKNLPFLLQQVTKDPLIITLFAKFPSVPEMPSTLWPTASQWIREERKEGRTDWLVLFPLIWPFPSHSESHSTLAALFQGTNPLVKHRDSPFPFISRALQLPFSLSYGKETNTQIRSHRNYIGITIRYQKRKFH